MQTTSIDQETGLIRLTTMLAHSSGEWVSSDWPVCPVGETAAPHKMGAALTYARRYALFTLVGIAGEDDLDASDLPGMKLDGGIAGPSNLEKPNGQHAGAIDSRPPYRKGSPRKLRASVPILSAEALAAMRDRLAAEIGGLGSIEVGVEWARGSIAAKNTLSAADASAVETAFRDRMQVLEAGREASAEDQVVGSPTASPPGSAIVQDPSLEETQQAAVGRHKGSQRRRSRASDEVKAERIDKSVLTIAEPRRYRNREHLRLVAQNACLVCGRKPSDPHHLGFMQPRVLGRKVSDEFTVPLCRTHHRAAHRAGDERAWWEQVGIDPVKVARELWRKVRLSDGTLQPSLRTPPPGLDAAECRDREVGNAPA